MLKTVSILPAAISLFLAGVAQGGGFAHNANFLVLAPDQQLAEEVLARADDLRSEIAVEWLGKRLDPACGRTMIQVEYSKSEDRGLTWPVDSAKRRYPRIWLTTSRERALGSTLQHELVHSVLSTRFSGSLPKWAEEGAASLSDDAKRVKQRRQIIQDCVHTGRWPRLERIVNANSIPRHDKVTYAVAASLTEFLVSLRDKPSFLAFAVASKQRGWDSALEDYCGMQSTEQLLAEWRSWASRRDQMLTAAQRDSGATVASVDP